MSALPPKADIFQHRRLCPLLTLSRHSALLTNVVADDAAGEAGQDRREGGQSWAVRHVPIGRGCRAEELVSGNPAADR